MEPHSNYNFELNSSNKTLTEKIHTATFDAAGATAEINMLYAAETVDDEAILDGTMTTNSVTIALSPEPINATVMAAMQQMRDIQKLCHEMDSIAEISLLPMATHFSKAHLTNSLDSLAAATSRIAVLCGSLRSISKLDEFTLFPKLPMELRIKIWKAAMPRSRFVSASYKQDTINGSSPTPSTPWGIWGNQKAPATLHVCHESRVEALKKYKLRLDTVGRDGYVRMDPDEDTLVLLVTNVNLCGDLPRKIASKPGVLIFGNVLKESALKSIKQIAVEELAFIPQLSRPDGTPYSWRNAQPVHHFQAFEALENLALITYHHTSTGEFNFLKPVDKPENSQRNYHRQIQDCIVGGMVRHKITNPEYCIPKVSLSMLI